MKKQKKFHFLRGGFLAYQNKKLKTFLGGGAKQKKKLGGRGGTKKIFGVGRRGTEAFSNLFSAKQHLGFQWGEKIC